MIDVNGVSFQIRKNTILQNVSFRVSKGAWLGVLGENGSGKTTLLDLLMGFKTPTGGKITVNGKEPHLDPFRDRESIAYLSEKVDLPGDCSVGDFLEFNAGFYRHYDSHLERELCQLFKISKSARVGNLSAGEVRRAQIVGALSYRPRMILVDEITAVLDIVVRRKLMRALKERTQEGSTLVFATNILEGLHGNITDLVLISQGRSIQKQNFKEFLSSGSEHSFYDQVTQILEAA